MQSRPALLAVFFLFSLGHPRAETPSARWKLHVFTTGRDRIAPSFLGGFVTGWSPIQAYVLENSDHKLILFDTGLNHQAATDPFYCNCWTHVAADYDLRAGEDLPTQMQRAGLEPANVTHVVLSHPHSDHTGEVMSFASAQVWIGARDLEWAAGQSTVRAVHLWEFANAPHLHRDIPSSLTGEGQGGGGVDLLGDGTLTLLSFPGHTPGSQALLVKLPNGPLLLAGDAYANTRAAQWVRSGHAPGGLHAKAPQMAKSLAAIDALIAATPGLVVLGGHESEIPPRADIVVHAFSVEPTAAPLSIWDESRATLSLGPAVTSVGPSSPTLGVYGGLTYDVLPCFSLDTVVNTSFRLSGNARRLGNTYLDARYNFPIAENFLAFVNAGPALLFVESDHDGQFAFASGAVFGGGLLRHLGSAFDLRADVTASFAFGDVSQHLALTAGLGLGMRL